MPISATSRNAKVCILGAGIGGASVAFFLRNLTSPASEFDNSRSAAATASDSPLLNLDIHVFERSNRVGGRAHTICFEGTEVEAGASIIHDKNLHLVAFAKLLGLKRVPSPDAAFGIWAGREDGSRPDKPVGWVFKSVNLGDSDVAKWIAGWLTSVQMIMRYSFSGLTAMNSMVQVSVPHSS